MRILDEDRDQAVLNATLYLTEDEAKEVAGSLSDLVNDPTSSHHHVNDLEFERELTLTVFRPHQLNEYNKRSQKLIIEGE